MAGKNVKLARPTRIKGVLKAKGSTIQVDKDLEAELMAVGALLIESAAKPNTSNATSDIKKREDALVKGQKDFEQKVDDQRKAFQTEADELDLKIEEHSKAVTAFKTDVDAFELTKEDFDKEKAAFELAKKTVDKGSK